MDRIVPSKEHWTIFLQKLNMGDISAAQRHLVEAVRLSPAILEESERFVEAVVEYTQSPDIQDPLVFAQDVLENLPDCAETLRRFRPRLLGSLFIAEAFRFYDSNYMSRVRGAVLAGLRYDPSYLRNKGVISIFCRSFFRQHFNKNKLLKKELVRIVEYFEENNLKAWLFGSFAVSLYANKFIKSHFDVDLVFLTIEDCGRAEALLIKNFGYRIEKKQEYLSEHGRGVCRTLLISDSNLRVDISKVDELGWNYSLDTFVEIENTKVLMISLNDLRRCYADHLEDQHAISYRETLKTIDQLLLAPH